MEETKKIKAQVLELLTVIMLGITAVATAWSSWQGGLHGSQMDQKYTLSNNLATEGNSAYNAGIQALTHDMMIFNEINNLLIEQAIAEEFDDDAEMVKINWKLDELVEGSASEELTDAINWALEESGRTGHFVSPFEREGFTDMYFLDAAALLAQSEEMLEAGNINNTHSDNQGLVSVLYAVVLFLLGISTSIKGDGSKYVLLIMSGVGFAASTIFMFTIPIVFP